MNVGKLNVQEMNEKELRIVEGGGSWFERELSYLSYYYSLRRLWHHVERSSKPCW